MGGLLLAMVLGCGASDDLGSWEGCLSESAAISESDRVVSVVAGDQWILNLHQSRGGLPFVTDAGSSRWLVITLPRPPVVGESQPLPGAAGLYRQGGQLLSYQARSSAGEVEVLDLDDRRARLRVSARTTRPEIDLDGLGEVSLRGEVAVSRSRGGQCP